MFRGELLGGRTASTQPAGWLVASAAEDLAAGWWGDEFVDQLVEPVGLVEVELDGGLFAELAADPSLLGEFAQRPRRASISAPLSRNF